MKTVFAALGIFAGIGALFLLFTSWHTFTVSREAALVAPVLPPLPEAAPPPPPPVQLAADGDIAVQEPLQGPPRIVKAVYATSWTAGSQKSLGRLIELIDRTELNGIVIDIKDYSGYMAYRADIPEAKAIHAQDEIRIAKPNALIKMLHAHGIYVIGRISVFQDPLFARAHPEWALADVRTGEVWRDTKGLAWMDPAATAAWEYNAAIAKDALARGFDEINFDYIRFASDGELAHIVYPVWDEMEPKHEVIGRFFSYVRGEFPNAVLSADLFGLATINENDLGIGQLIENAYRYFDFVSPMVYPSHYAPGFLGFTNPAAHPYEVVRYSLERAGERLTAFIAADTQSESVASSTASTSAGSAGALHGGRSLVGVRPWLQDFNLGAEYDAEKVQAQIRAVEDVLYISTSSLRSDAFSGWLLWDPNNRYTDAALRED